MGEHTVKQVVYFRQKQGRGAHLKRSVDPLSVEPSRSKARQRDTPGVQEECKCPA